MEPAAGPSDGVQLTVRAEPGEPVQVLARCGDHGPPLVWNYPMIVRAARHGDLPDVLELWSLARSEHATTRDRAEDVERLVREMPGSLLVAEDGARLVGALIAAWDGWRGACTDWQFTPSTAVAASPASSCTRASTTCEPKEPGGSRPGRPDNNVAGALWAGPVTPTTR